jgi:uncharacterized membrane-anchored protein YitT (DUF2179 family)
VSVAFNVYLSANHVTASGIGGVSTPIAIMLCVSLGLVYSVLNIPLFLSGSRYVGISFYLQSNWGSAMPSLFFTQAKNIPVFHDTLLTVLLGDAIRGVAIEGVSFVGAASEASTLATQL